MIVCSYTSMSSKFTCLLGEVTMKTCCSGDDTRPLESSECLLGSYPIESDSPASLPLSLKL